LVNSSILTDRMPLLTELRGNGPRAFTNPAQGRFRIAACFTVNQLIQGVQKTRIGNSEALASTACTTNMILQRAVSIFNFTNPLANGLAGQSTRPVNDGSSAIT